MIDRSLSKTDVELHSAPIDAHWLISGKPVARNRAIFKSADGTAYTMVWDCTAGSFIWKYDCDETFYVTEGAAFLTMGGETREVGPGSVVFFPAGSEAVWQVDIYIRKVAFVRQTVPTAVGVVLRLWRWVAIRWRGQQGASNVIDSAKCVIAMSSYEQAGQEPGQLRTQPSPIFNAANDSGDRFS